MNEYDSNRISDLVEKAGYTKTENIFDIVDSVIYTSNNQGQYLITVLPLDTILEHHAA